MVNALRSGSPVHPEAVMTFRPGQWRARVDRLAGEWRLPSDLVAAALVDEADPAALAADEVEPYARARERAAGFAAWQTEFLGDAAADLNHRLRALLRAVYCDAPGFGHVLTLLAARHARLFSPAADAALAQEMLDVFVPVAQMLGLYRFRRRWIEESARLLYPEAYREKAGKLNVHLDGPTSEGLDEAVAAWQLAWVDQETDGRLPAIDDQAPTFDERLRLFALLNKKVREGLEDEFGDDAPPVELLPLLPGYLLHGQRYDTPDDRNPLQLTVRVLCQTPSDCYRALGVIHSRFTVRSGVALRPHDYIAAPLTNGYRALQTVCSWQPNPTQAERRPVKFHILTADMHDVNEWGILSASAASPGHRRRLTAWWSQPDKPTRTLPRGTNREAWINIPEHLRRHPLGSHAAPLYCFTPLGELFLLEKDSTALDFAYHIHTELGHRAARIDVNGRPAALNAPLRNGDQVRVVLDPHAARIDFVWPSLATNARTRADVRRMLRRLANAVHPGRGRFEEEVMRLIDRYQRDRARGRKPLYTPPTPTTTDIERFLDRVITRDPLDDRAALYERLDKNPALARALAHELLSHLIFADLPVGDASRSRYELGQLELCSFCRPIPGDKLRTVTRYGPNGLSETIHTDYCRHAQQAETLSDPHQVHGNLPDRWPMYHFDIEMPDSKQLLARLLEKVYQLPNAYLFGVRAEVNVDGWAIIELDVALMQPQLCADLRRMIESLGHGAHADFRRLPGDPRAKVEAADLSRAITIPFTESEVTDWRFFDRDGIIGAIQTWLQEPAAPVLLLHGQRRVGKSSIARRLVEHNLTERLSPPVVAVYVDFRAPVLRRPGSVAALIAQEVSLRLGLPLPRLEPHEDAMVWLNGQLGAAVRQLGDRRLLLIIDEFDAELEADVRAGRQPPALAGWRAIQRAHPEIRWLLVLQDVFLADPAFQMVLADIPRETPRLAVHHLAGPYARLLIERLAVERGFTYQPIEDGDDIPAQIIRWTAGNPYLIHVIGRRLLERAGRCRRRVILQNDLKLILHQLLDRGEGYLSHFIEHIEAHPGRRLVAAFVAGRVRLSWRLPLATAAAVLSSEFGLLDPDETERHARFLEQVGVFEINNDPERGPVLSFPIQLLQEWIRHYWEFDQIAAAWPASSARRAALAREGVS